MWTAEGFTKTSEILSEPQEKIIVFRAYDTPVEANIAKTKLDAYGIPCFLTEENMTNLYPIRNGIFPGTRLHIFEKDYDQVKGVLDENQAEGFIVCPYCGSNDYHPILTAKEGSSFFSKALQALFSSKPVLEYKCNKCNRTYTPS
jgi:DNA-directed RNA polymerase subunit RPC12/RpoP